MRKLLDLQEGLQPSGAGVWGSVCGVSLPEKTGAPGLGLLYTTYSTGRPTFPFLLKAPSPPFPLPLTRKPKPLGQFADSDCGSAGGTGPAQMGGGGGLSAGTNRPYPARRNVGAKTEAIGGFGPGELRAPRGREWG